MANTNLTAAKKAKQDEFYTLLTDIEKEVFHYREQFKDKIVYCNCDDARESNFFKYFSMNFEFLGLKKLICTGYKENGHGVVLLYEGDKNGNKIVDDDEIKVTELQGNGSFDSEECITFLQQADIVVTNPPFSLFRPYMKQLFDYNKKFLVIGNMNAITFKEIFPYIKDGKLQTGYNFNKTCEFVIPDSYSKYNTINDLGQKIGKVPAITWYTNLQTDKKENPTCIFKTYKGHEDEYPHYDNYDAIEVSKIANMPIDIPIGGVVGVPITIVDKIASDGLIYFDDGGMGQNYDIEKFRHGNDGKDLGFSVERERESRRTSESSSDVSSSEYVNNERCQCELLGNDKQCSEICTHLYQTYTLIGHEHDLNGDGGSQSLSQFEVNGGGVYKRILIKRIG